MTDTPEIARIRAALKAYAEAGYYDLPQCDELQDACSTNSIRRVLAHIDAQAAEIERLRVDAERYRWLRDPCSGAENAVMYGRGDFGCGLMSGIMLDDAIDAAVREKS